MKITEEVPNLQRRPSVEYIRCTLENLKKYGENTK